MLSESNIFLNKAKLVSGNWTCSFSKTMSAEKSSRGKEKFNSSFSGSQNRSGQRQFWLASSIGLKSNLSVRWFLRLLTGIEQKLSSIIVVFLVVSLGQYLFEVSKSTICWLLLRVLVYLSWNLWYQNGFLIKDKVNTKLVFISKAIRRSIATLKLFSLRSSFF